MKELKLRVWMQVDDTPFVFLGHEKLSEGRNWSCRQVTDSFWDMGVFFKLGINFARDQYTNIKDKGGNEIYEGDIVSIETPDPKPKVGEVKRDVTGAWIVGEWTWPLYQFQKNATIIGNIHENPELLTQ